MKNNASTKRSAKPKRFKAWMVVDVKGKPVIERHPWGGNLIISKTAAEAPKWSPGERTVRVVIEIWK